MLGLKMYDDIHDAIRATIGVSLFVSDFLGGLMVSYYFSVRHVLCYKVGLIEITR